MSLNVMEETGVLLNHLQFIVVLFWLNLFALQAANIVERFGKYAPIIVIGFFGSAACVLIVAAFFWYKTWFAIFCIFLSYCFAKIAGKLTLMRRIEFFQDYSIDKVHEAQQTCRFSSFEEQKMSVGTSNTLIILVFMAYLGFSKVLGINPGGNIIGTVLKWAFYILIGLLIAGLFMEHFSNARRFGYSSMKDFKRWIKQGEISKYALNFDQISRVYHYWGLLYLSLFLFFKSNFFIYLMVFNYAIIIRKYFYHHTPPSILLLSTSSPDKLHLLNLIKTKTNFFRIFSLLNLDHLRSGGGYFSRNRRLYAKLLQDNLRPAVDKYWREIVHSLMDFALIVLIDTRDSSPALEEETLHMLQPERLHKIIFLVSTDNEHPLLDKVLPGEIPATYKKRFVNAEQIISTLNDILLAYPKEMKKRNKKLNSWGGASVRQNGKAGKK